MVQFHGVLYSLMYTFSAHKAGQFNSALDCTVALQCDLCAASFTVRCTYVREQEYVQFD
jgi:hypothetical protein